ncbi:hypothetical protein FRX31_030694 [Thalictrum thalictroides]|uniref:Uncharacterized protein n=1 Tax=Thalictrum thalictroides TaxID=46969 RepID=A0A7J6V3T6_THATH|nr:hypothetical protein FRX31_030694 [Thalictrum thalictroides]
MCSKHHQSLAKEWKNARQYCALHETQAVYQPCSEPLEVLHRDPRALDDIKQAWVHKARDGESFPREASQEVALPSSASDSSLG